MKEEEKINKSGRYLLISDIINVELNRTEEVQRLSHDLSDNVSSKANLRTA